VHRLDTISFLATAIIAYASSLFKYSLFYLSLSFLVLCQDLVQVKMRNFSHFNPPEAQPQCVFFHTIVRIHLVTYSYNGYECHASNYSSHLRQLYRRLNPASPSYHLFQRAVFYGTFLSALLTIRILSHIVFS